MNQREIAQQDMSAAVGNGPTNHIAAGIDAADGCLCFGNGQLSALGREAEDFFVARCHIPSGIFDPPRAQQRTGDMQCDPKLILHNVSLSTVVVAECVNYSELDFL
jgi:hypothetical protein